MGPDLEKVLLTEEEIDQRLDELAAAIDATTPVATRCSSASSRARSW